LFYENGPGEEIVRYLARLDTYTDFGEDLNLFPRSVGDMLATDFVSALGEGVLFPNPLISPEGSVPLADGIIGGGTAYATADAIVVEEEDTLWDLAGKAYGDPAKWQLGQLASPDLIYPGMKLEVPR